MYPGSPLGACTTWCTPPMCTHTPCAHTIMVHTPHVHRYLTYTHPHGAHTPPWCMYHGVPHGTHIPHVDTPSQRIHTPWAHTSMVHTPLWCTHPHGIHTPHVPTHPMVHTPHVHTPHGAHTLMVHTYPTGTHPYGTYLPWCTPSMVHILHVPTNPMYPQTPWYTQPMCTPPCGAPTPWCTHSPMVHIAPMVHTHRAGLIRCENEGCFPAGYERGSWAGRRDWCPSHPMADLCFSKAEPLERLGQGLGSPEWSLQ